MEKRIKADLHNHFSTWESGWGDFDYVIDKISRRFGEGVIGLANCEDQRYENFVDSKQGKRKYERVEIGDDKNALWLPQKNLLIVKGQEVFTNQGHFLVLATPKKHKVILKNLGEVVKEANDIGAPAIAIHPYLHGTGQYLEQHQELIDKIDSIEIYNASLGLFGDGFNNLAKNLYLDNNFFSSGCCSFTDGHSARAIGTSYTQIPQLDITSSETLRASLKEALRQTKTEDYLVKNPAIRDAIAHAFELYVLRHLRKK